MAVRTIYIAYRLLKEALHRLTGLDREASFLTTGFVFGVLAVATAPITAPLFRVFRLFRRRPPMPSLGTSAMAGAVVRHAVRGIGGDALRTTPFAGAIIATGLLAPSEELIALPVRLIRAAFAGIARAWRYILGPVPA